MVDNYSTIKYTPTEEEEIAVGRLMQYCGRAVKMEYSDVSGALVIDVPPAMSSYFNMNPYVQSVTVLIIILRIGKICFIMSLHTVVQ